MYCIEIELTIVIQGGDTMINFKSIKILCYQFLNTKRSQSFISNKTCDKIKDARHQASLDEDHIDLTRSVYRSIAVANGIYPLGYFLD